MKMAVALLLVLSACFVVSAQEEERCYAKITADNTSSEIGYTVFIFEIPHHPDYNGTDRGFQQMVDDNGTIYDYFLEGMKFEDEDGGIGAFFGLAYFEAGKPPVEVSHKDYLEDFAEIGGTVLYALDDGQAVDIAGFSGVKWLVKNPINQKNGILAQVQVDEFRAINILADFETFDLFNRTLTMGVLTERGIVLC